MTVADAALDAAIAPALDRPLPPAAREMALHLAKRRGVAAVLFYGNRLRADAPGTLLDFYVLTDSHVAWHGWGAAALANRLLPPNVYFEQIGDTGAKVAVLTLAQFAHRMRPEAWDTTLWARFVQPAALAFVRDAPARARVTAALRDAARTAAWWAIRLTPARDDPMERWRGLFRQTYRAELRVETGARAHAIVDAAPAHFAALATVLLDGPEASDDARRAARVGWQARVMLGKLRNVARLMKAAATFRGGIAYALSKVERHSGRPVRLTGWQRRHPALAAPLVFLRLLWERRLR